LNETTQYELLFSTFTELRSAQVADQKVRVGFLNEALPFISKEVVELFSDEVVDMVKSGSCTPNELVISLLLIDTLKYYMDNPYSKVLGALVG
jgi:hypothetical protein